MEVLADGKADDATKGAKGEKGGRRGRNLTVTL
jgi:hypothetical protein